MTVKPLFAWYDLWIGAFWDRKAHKLYILPLPCIGIVITFDACRAETSVLADRIERHVGDYAAYDEGQIFDLHPTDQMLVIKALRQSAGDAN